MTRPLTGKQRRHLRALAHHIDPVIQIGNAGVTEGFLAELGRALHTHELVKVRVGTESPITATDSVLPIETGTKSQVAQVIGRTLIVYRRRQKDPKIVLPKEAGKK